MHLERIAFESHYVQVTAIALKIRPDFFVEQFIDLFQFGAIGGGEFGRAFAFGQPGGSFGEFLGGLFRGGGLANRGGQFTQELFPLGLD